MEPRKSERRSAEAWSNLFRVELGHPVYSWQWSEDLLIHMIVRDEQGRFEYDYRANHKTGLIEPVRKVVSRRVCYPSVENQWVMCQLITQPQRDWMRQFGDSMEWPENGRWCPLNGPGGYAALPPGEFPNRNNTERSIRIIRESREARARDLKGEAELASLKHEERKDAKRRSILEVEVDKALHAPQNTVYSLGADAHEQKEVIQ